MIFAVIVNEKLHSLGRAQLMIPALMGGSGEHDVKHIVTLIVPKRPGGVSC